MRPEASTAKPKRYAFTLVVEERDDLEPIAKQSMATFIKHLLEKDAYLYVAAIGWSEEGKDEQST